LEKLLTATEDVRQLKRTQALLWLAEGDSVEEVAERLRVTRQTVYNWVARFEARAELSLEWRVADGARPGRPRTALEIIDPLIESVLDEDPRQLGYRSTIWTAPLWQQHLAGVHQIEVSGKSVSRALARLDIIWKRPRHQLARQDGHWRQAEGGSNAASGRGHARSS
jgi:transposase